MARTSVPGGMVLVYGVAIGNALATSGATVEELITLRSHAQALVDGQGDITSALSALDKEIANRGGQGSAKSAPPAADPSSERFMVQVDGLAISPDARQRIEQAINNAVKTAIAGHDSAGDLVITPLSQIKSFGGRLGGATAGMIAYPERLR
jgi:Domain of unknown function (DUF1843)